MLRLALPFFRSLQTIDTKRIINRRRSSSTQAAKEGFKAPIILILVLAAAGLNAWLFHRKSFRAVVDRDRERRAPARARVAAVLSLLLWAGVIAAGRLIAYL